LRPGLVPVTRRALWCVSAEHPLSTAAIRCEAPPQTRVVVQVDVTANRRSGTGTRRASKAACVARDASTSDGEPDLSGSNQPEPLDRRLVGERCGPSSFHARERRNGSDRVRRWPDYAWARTS